MKVSETSEMNNQRRVPMVQRQQKPAHQDQQRLPWSSLEQQVVRMQKQIAQAYQQGDRRAVYSLQQRLLESEAARLLAVRRVAEKSQGKDTAGVDGVKSLSHAERLSMASTIHPSHWKQQRPEPLRRVWIPKPGSGERRPLGILPMIDRCKQALIKLALEPEWEMRFETHSYAYRPGRSVHDAIAAVLVAIERHPMYVYSADIEGAFDHINQSALLQKLQACPTIEEMIRRWFKAGIMDGSVYVPSEMGIAQGSVLSPLLMNVALHGMDEVVTGGASNGGRREGPLLIRYGDDFVIVHEDLQQLKQADLRVRPWLAALGLQLNAQKTRVSHTLTPFQGNVGFDFLGFHIQQQQMEKGVGGKGKQKSVRWLKTIVNPTPEAMQRHNTAIEQRVHAAQNAPQAQIIKALNPLIVGWTGYYNGIVEAASMGHYDELMEQHLLRWASQRHPGRTRDWLLAQYWQQSRLQERVFASADGQKLRTYRQKSFLER